MGFLLEAIGTAVPAHSAAQSDVLRVALEVAGAEGRERRSIEALYRKSGIERRGSVLIEREGDELALPFYDGKTPRRGGSPGTAERMERFARHSVDLAETAARAALGAAGVSGGGVTRLVVVSCTGFFAPGVDLALLERLGLSPRVKRAQVGFMGCHGAMNGLEVASAMARGCAPGERVLLVAVEICSLHAQGGMVPDDVVANAIFADGAAAVVGRWDEAGDAPGLRLLATRSVVIPESREAMTWRIGDHGFRMELSAAVPDLILRHMRPAVEGWLAEEGLSLEGIGAFAVHPGGVRILDAVQRALDLGPGALAASRAVLRRHGNMSSPTILFVLEELRRQGARPPWLAAAFGPGLTMEVALLDGPRAAPPVDRD